MRRELLFARRDDALPFMNNIGYIFIVRRLGKQSKLILSRSDSISDLKLNLRIHGPCGPDAHAGANLQAFFFYYFKPILFSAHKLILLIYSDNTCPPGFGNNNSKTTPSLHLAVNAHQTAKQPPRKMQRLCNWLLIECETADPSSIFSLFNLTRIGSSPQQTPSSSQSQ